MMELKTLKDLPKEVIGIEDRMISETKLKAEAVKWVKEEKEIKENKKIGIYHHLTETVRWMKRLDITEEDLK